MTRRRRNRWVFIGVVVMATFALSWAFHPYRVVGNSMEPSLLAGDWLMADHATPARDDLVIFHEPDSGRLGVKRVAALPGERVQLIGGDLWIDGQRLTRAATDAEALVPLLDERGTAAAALMHFEGDPIETTDQNWHLEGQARAFLATPPDGGYLRRGKLVHAVEPAIDLGLEVAYTLLDERAQLDLILRKGKAIFTASLSEGGHRLEVQMSSGADTTTTTLFTQNREDGAAHASGHAFFTLMDGVLSVALDGELVVDRLPYPEPAPLALAEVPADFPLVEHAGLGGSGPLEIGRIRLGRDLLHASAGTYGTGVGLQLQDGEYFLLGDNPASSRDSRHYGPVSSDLLVGTVAARLWPRHWTMRGWRRD